MAISQTSIKDLSEIVNINVQTALTQIKGEFGDELPDVHSWTGETLLPDDPIGGQILDFLGLKKSDIDAIAVIDRAELTTVESKLNDAAQAREYALSAISDALRVSISDYLTATLTEAVITGYNEAQDTAHNLLADVALNDIEQLQEATQSALAKLSSSVDALQKKGDTLRGKMARLQTTGSQFSNNTRSQLQSIRESLRKQA